LHAQGVKFLGFRESIADFGEARDDAAAVTKHRNGAAFPVTLAGFVGVLELTEQGIGYIANTLVRVVVAQTLDSGNKARPGAIFQFVEHRRWVILVSHVPSPSCLLWRGLCALRAAVT
jgi:hypothetical protein